MKNIRHMSRKSNWTAYLLTILVLYFLFCMISEPAKYISKSLDGISAWAMSVLPSVLPFMFFTKVLSSLDCMQSFTRPFSAVGKTLFKTPPISFYTFLMAIMSGYPVGSKMVADLFLQGKITREDAFKMTSFCSTSGPMFIIGAVGIGMFKNQTIGYILFISHVLGAILNGILFGRLKLRQNNSLQDEPPLPQNQNSAQKKSDISEIVLNSTLAILSVGCIITIFFIVIECFSPLLSLLPDTLRFFAEGVIEITKGCIDISSLQNLNLATILCSFVISFGGISTVLQSLTMLSSIKMRARFFLLQKFCHAIFSTLVTVVLLLIFKI